MFKKNKVLILILALVMVISACGGNSGSNSESNNGSNNGGTKAPADSGTNDSGVDISEFVTVTYTMMGDRPTNGQLELVMEELNAILKERVNAHLQLNWVEWADWTTKYNLLLASGEPLDLITIATTWLDTWGNAARGAFMGLDDLLPDYAPRTWDEVSLDHWDQSKFDDKIVFIPEDNYTQWVNHGFFYRGDWAQEFGITEPIQDFYTFGDYLQGVKDNKPGVIPYDVNGSRNELYGGYVSAFTQYLELPIATGFANVFYANSYDDRYTVGSPIFDDTFIEFANLMKDWSDKGYWREDVLAFTGDTRVAMRGGLSGADQHHTQTYRTLRIDMDRDQPGSELQMFPWALQSGNLLSMPISHGGTSIGTNSKNPERALMIYDLIRHDEEIYMLFNFGIEGVQYNMVDGKRTRPAGYNADEHGFSSNFWGGRVDRFHPDGDNEYEGAYELYDLYDEIKKPYPYGQFVFDRTPIEAELSAMGQVTGQLVPAILFGKVSNPAEAIQQLRDRLMTAGYEKALAEIQRQMDEFRAMVE